MMNAAQHRGLFSRVRLQAASGVLVLSVFLPVVVAAQSAHEPTYSYKVLYDFCTSTNCPDGSLPQASLIQDAKGNLYGATPLTVFKLDKAGKETVLYTFGGGTDGEYSTSNLVRDSAGNLYGTTQSGGDLSCDAPYGCGVVFEVDSAGHETVLHSFEGGTDGMRPVVGLIRDSRGNFYGTTEFGGSTNDCGVAGWGCGTVFKLTKSGKETVLYTFAGGADSFMPEGGLVMDAKGNLYGTTYGGGTANPGTVFKVTKYGKETVLYTFRTGEDGSAPMGSLAMDAKGNLYGTTSGNNGDSNGTVFKLTKAGRETVLWRFQGAPDGREPQAGVVMDAAGNLYGTTLIGGSSSSCPQSGGCGTVFKLDKKGTDTVLYMFTGGSDGGFPRAGLFRDAKGNLYGTTTSGGYSNFCPYEGQGCGAVFRMTP
jgi:uncharacterized repeat protein (TIGR03803 family)